MVLQYRNTGPDENPGTKRSVCHEPLERADAVTRNILDEIQNWSKIPGALNDTADESLDQILVVVFFGE